jgi:hypothetical protein
LATPFLATFFTFAEDLFTFGEVFLVALTFTTFIGSVVTPELPEVLAGTCGTSAAVATEGVMRAAIIAALIASFFICSLFFFNHLGFQDEVRILAKKLKLNHSASHSLCIPQPALMADLRHGFRERICAKDSGL